MNILLDASTLINLINSEVLSFVFRIPNVKFFVGSYVEGECFNKDQADLISNAINEGALHLATEEVKLSEFALYKKELNLGDGETECIILGLKNTSYIIGSDDKKARKLASHKLGGSRIIGSLFLLRQAFRSNLLTCEEVKLYYAAMIVNGAFLPNVGEAYLCQSVN